MTSCSYKIAGLGRYSRFFIVDVSTREEIHVVVTRSPNDKWTAQQSRKVTSPGRGADLLIQDRDTKFGGEFDRVAQGAGMQVVITPVRTPNMNAVCERFLGSIRRECLDHILILNEEQLKGILREYTLSYFNNSRPHQGIAQRVPDGNSPQLYNLGLDIIYRPVLGGIHQEYQVSA